MMIQSTALLLLSLLGVASLPAQTFRPMPTTGGSQFIELPAGRTTIVAPALQPPAVAQFAVSLAGVAAGVATVNLAGAKPLDLGNAPLRDGQYGGRVISHYAMVTAGDWVGHCLGVKNNTATSLELWTGDLQAGPRSIRHVEIRPYWTLASLLPASVAEVSFVPTTDAAAVKTRVVLSPSGTRGNEQPQDAGQAYYFRASMGCWVREGAPDVDAGSDRIAPGAYLYLQNGFTGSRPQDLLIAGTSLDAPFRLLLQSSAAETALTYFGLPRSLPCRLSKMGWNDSNFTPSLNTSPAGRNDVLLLDDGFGGVGAAYYRHAGRWYQVGAALPVDPLMAVGSVFAVVKKVGARPGSFLLNVSP